MISGLLNTRKSIQPIETAQCGRYVNIDFMRRQYRVPTAKRALDVIERLSKEDRGMSLPEIHRSSRLPSFLPLKSCLRGANPGSFRAERRQLGLPPELEDAGHFAATAGQHGHPSAMPRPRTGARHVPTSNCRISASTSRSHRVRAKIGAN